MSHIETQCSHVPTECVRNDASLSEHVIETHLVFRPRVAPFSIFLLRPHFQCPTRCLQPGIGSPWGEPCLRPALKTTSVNMLIHPDTLPDLPLWVPLSPHHGLDENTLSHNHSCFCSVAVIYGPLFTQRSWNSSIVRCSRGNWRRVNISFISALCLA